MASAPNTLERTSTWVYNINMNKVLCVLDSIFEANLDGYWENNRTFTIIRSKFDENSATTIFTVNSYQGYGNRICYISIGY